MCGFIWKTDAAPTVGQDSGPGAANTWEGVMEPVLIAPDDVLLLAIDAPADNPARGATAAAWRRAYFMGSGADYRDRRMDRFVSVTARTLSTRPASQVMQSCGGGAIAVVLYPTATYSEGSGDRLFAEIAPEDRAIIRRIARLYPRALRYFTVPLQATALFEALPEYFADDRQRAAYRRERTALKASEGRPRAAPRRAPVWFDASYLKNLISIFRQCITRPSRLDYFYLVTKTFTINLMVRLAFAVHGVAQTGLTPIRAVTAMVWYTLQDAVMTIYGQTYMKFLGRLTGMLHVGKAAIGDFLFVYVQYCTLEFFNRLIIGPLGENPPAYTWQGLGLILLNNVQGLISGGPLTPAINKLREKGLISYNAMMNLYQVSSLTFYFGMFASFGHQTIYAILTGSVMVLAWGAYLALSFWLKDPPFQRRSGLEDGGSLDACAAACYGHATNPT